MVTEFLQANSCTTMRIRCSKITVRQSNVAQTLTLSATKTQDQVLRYMYVDAAAKRRSSRLESYTPIDLIVRKCGLRLSYKSTDTQSI